MFKTLMRAGLLAATISLGAASGASAAMQMPAPAALLTGESQVAPITFWAQPYPYRYAPWGAVARWCESRRPMAGIWIGFARLSVPSCAGRTEFELTGGGCRSPTMFEGSRTADAAALLVFVSLCADLLCAQRRFTMNIFVRPGQAVAW
ncbi:hypothetical protein ACVWW2_002599 [Bradyrhizobium sp. LM4.3]